MTNEKKPYDAAQEISLDIFAQMRELRKSAHKVGSIQLEPGEVYLSFDCLAELKRTMQFYEEPVVGEPDRIFGLPIYPVHIDGYHVRVAPRLAMRTGVEL